MPSPGLSIAAYADHRRASGLDGANPSAVQTALELGRIKRNRRGKIDPQQADADWEASTRPSMHKESSGKKQQSYADARAERERYQAQLARLELEKKEGLLVETEKVNAAAFENAVTVREAFLGIVPRVEADVAATDDIKEVRRILNDAIRDVLSRLADRYDE